MCGSTCISGLNILFHLAIFISLYTTQYIFIHYLDYYNIIVSLEIRQGRFYLQLCPSLLKIVMAILGPLHLHIYFRTSLSISTKTPAEFLTGAALTLQSNLGRTDFLILNHIIHGKYISHLFRSSLISLLQLSAYGLYTCFVKFIPEHFLFLMLL